MGNKSSAHSHAISTHDLHNALSAHNGHHVSLHSHISNGHVSADHHGHVTASAPEGHSAHWKLHYHGGDVVQLESKSHPGHYLRADNHSVTATGSKEDHHTKFHVEHHHQSGHVTLRNHDGHGLGFESNGHVKPPASCGNGPHTHLRFEFH